MDIKKVVRKLREQAEAKRALASDMIGQRTYDNAEVWTEATKAAFLAIAFDEAANWLLAEEEASK